MKDEYRAVRAARDARIRDSMNCSKCGAPSAVDSTFDRPTIDGAMGTKTRLRECRACGDTWRTVEINAQELQSLRVAASMHFLSLSPRAPS